MQNKSLLFGIGGFLLGGLVVATAFSVQNHSMSQGGNHAEMTMSEMTTSLQAKTGDAYDKAWIEHMIMHHQSAVDMAKLSASRAKHDEVKKLSDEIIATQQKEIDTMKAWQEKWGYGAAEESHEHNHREESHSGHSH